MQRYVPACCLGTGENIFKFYLYFLEISLHYYIAYIFGNRNIFQLKYFTLPVDLAEGDDLALDVAGAVWHELAHPGPIRGEH